MPGVIPVEHTQAMALNTTPYSYTATGMEWALNKEELELTVLQEKIDFEKRLLNRLMKKIHALSEGGEDPIALSTFIKTSFLPIVQSYEENSELKLRVQGTIARIQSTMGHPEFQNMVETEMKEEVPVTDEDLIKQAQLHIATAELNIPVDNIPSMVKAIESMVSAIDVEEYSCKDKPPCFEPGSYATIPQGYSDEMPDEMPLDGKVSRTPNTTFYTPAYVLGCTMKKDIGRACIVLYKVKGDLGQIFPRFAVVKEDCLKGPPKDGRCVLLPGNYGY
jgi:hypothetical protein